jgi:hypothetical protein
MVNQPPEKEKFKGDNQYYKMNWDFIDLFVKEDNPVNMCLFH